MNERLFRTQFNQMETTEKQALMESLATRYDMTFLGLHTFGVSFQKRYFEKIVRLQRQRSGAAVMATAAT